MPEHLRALIVIVGLATAVFAFSKAPACALASAAADFERRRNLWFGLTLAAFLAHNFWIYIVVAAVLLLMARPREPNKLAIFFFLLFAVPPIAEKIPGLGLVEHLFTIHHLRLLALAVLLPAFLFLRSQPDTERFGRSAPDLLITGYIILALLLHFTVDTLSNALRQGVFYAFIDIFLPYYVASREPKSLQAFRDALMAFVVAALVLSAIGAFEFARHWLLYSALQDALGVQDQFIGYLERSPGVLRALGTTGQPIVLGYAMCVAVGFMLFLRSSVPNLMSWRLGMVLLMAGLVAALSRGPWVGAAAILLVFLATDESAGIRLMILGLAGAIFLPVLLALPVGETIINHLPFIGSVDEENITYRQRLLEVAIQVISQNPLFGAIDASYLERMEELRQGQGIIDIVNTYVGVALSNGLVGLSLFSGFFIVVAFGIFKGMRNLTDRKSEHLRLGRALFSTLIGILVIIFTVSSISVIPAIYWSVAGLGVAYARMLRLAKVSEATVPAASRPVPVKIRS
jgi:O-antigen ligase